jgi:hypothetical protein
LHYFSLIFFHSLINFKFCLLELPKIGEQFFVRWQECLAAGAWRNNGVTTEVISQFSGDSPEKMKEGLKDDGEDYEWQYQSQ